MRRVDPDGLRSFHSLVTCTLLIREQKTLGNRPFGVYIGQKKREREKLFKRGAC